MRTMLFAAASLATVVFTATPIIMAASQPDLSGRWVPRDPARVAQQFDIGISDVTAAGMTIAMNGTSMTLTREGLPANGIGTVIPPRSSYAIGFDAQWQGEKLVVTTPGRNAISRSEFAVDQNGTLTVQTISTTTWGVTQQIVQNYRRAQ